MSAATGALLGLVGGGGVVLAASRVPALRRPTLDDRLAPYLRDTPRPSRLLLDEDVVTAFPTLERILRPVLRDGVRLLERILGGTASVRRRLEQSGRAPSVEIFRAEQLIWGVCGLVAGVVVSVLLLGAGTATSPVVLALVPLVAGVAGVLLRDRALTRAVAAREQRMMAEFPTIAELLALAVGAGESATGALERVTRISTGELSRELSRALADARGGSPLIAALEGVARRTTLPLLARFIDGVAVAVERGTPLADVLRAQANDVREAGKRALLEAGGRKEIAMMVPVVFLVLPVTVVFALFPGFYGITLSTP